MAKERDDMNACGLAMAEVVAMERPMASDSLVRRVGVMMSPDEAMMLS
jgi:hypothetical protein